MAKKITIKKNKIGLVATINHGTINSNLNPLKLPTSN